MHFQWKPHVPAAARRKNAERTAAKLRKKGLTLAPVAASRGAIATSFWGKAWCRNLEGYSDYANRLPRGRTYLRNGSVLDLQIGPGEVTAQVMGSSLYRITIRIREVAGAQWLAIASECARSIDTLVELLQGQLSTSVMERITRPGTGLFPSPAEISFSCSCPDSAALCKHVAATLYGIGARLDAEPELLFGLRRVDAKELIARVGDGAAPGQKRPNASRILDPAKLADVFGLDLGGVAEVQAVHEPAAKKRKAAASYGRTKSAKPVGKRAVRGHARKG